MISPSEGSAASIPFTKSEVDDSINKRFQKIARAVPDRVAVDVLTDRLTYAQLDELSDRIAWAIATRNNLPPVSPVAVLFEQKHFAMAAILGVLKAGKAAVVFIPDLPLEQLKYLWSDCLNPLVLTDQPTFELARQVVSSDTDCLLIDDLPTIDKQLMGEALLPEPKPGDLAIISYTSGSTGNPKGVMQSHRMILHSAYLNHTGLNYSPRDRNAVLATFGYGAAKTQIFAGLLNGATVSLPDFNHMKLSSLLDWLEQERVTILGSPPISFIRQLMDGMTEGKGLPHVRLVTSGGDDLFIQDVNQFWSKFSSQTTLHIRLTGSEVNLIREIHLHPGMEFSSEKVPVGYAVPDKEVWLVDEEGKKVGVGEMGEMVVQSRYLATGYWRQPELTAERFKVAPKGGEERIYFTGDLGRINEQGQMEHLGRKDNMVKVHGFSVHLETVDQALSRLTNVKEGAAAVVPLVGGDKRLVGYLVGSGGRKPLVGELRQELSGLLPEYMQPSMFMWLEGLPRTSTGKVDRKAFPPAPRERPDLGVEMVPPRDEREAGLAEIWQRVLQLDEVGVEDNFFDLGGDSLSSVQMVVEAEKLLGFTLSKGYFEKPTITNLVEQYLDWERGPGEQTQEEVKEHRVEAARRTGKKVSRYQAAVRKILHGEWSRSDIFRRTKWLVTSLLLDTKDYSIKKSILKSPYEEGLEKLSRWSSSPFVTKRLYRNLFQEFSQLLRDLEYPSPDYEVAFQASLMGNVFSRLGLHTYLEKANNDFVHLMQMVKVPFWVSFSQMLTNSSIKELDGLFPIYNREFLEQAYKAGRGVILLSYHSTVNRLALLMLSRRFYGDVIPTISEKRARRESIHWQNNFARDLRVQEFAALKAGVALEGQHLLEQGRLVQFASDNEYDRKGHPVTIAKRRYYLRPGFAELALNTGAAVVPMYNSLKLDGRIHMTFLQPLIVGTGNRESQIAALLDQYAAFINASWCAAPESIRWPRLMRHFDQPMIS